MNVVRLVALCVCVCVCVILACESDVKFVKYADVNGRVSIDMWESSSV